MDLGKMLFQAGAKIQEVLEWKIRVQSANNVKFSNRLAIAGSGGLECFLKRHCICAGRIFLASEGAQTTRSHAHVRGIDVAIDIEISLVGVHPLAYPVRQPTYGQNIPGAIQGEGVAGAEPFSA